MSGYLKEKNDYPRNMKISILSKCSLNYKGLNCALTQWGESAYSKENKTTSKIPGPNEESQKYQILKCFKRNTEY